MDMALRGLKSEPAQGALSNGESPAVKGNLWEEAVKQLKRSGALKVDRLDNNMFQRSFGSPEALQDAVQEKLEECNSRQWTYTSKDGEKVALREVLQRIQSWVSTFKEFGDHIVQSDLGHAALPWAMVRFILQASINDMETFGGMAEGLEMTAGIIVRYVEVERDALCGEGNLKEELAKCLVKLYSAVILYLAKVGAYFSQNTAKRVIKSAFMTSKQAVHDDFEKIRTLEGDVCKVTLLMRTGSQDAILTSIRQILDSWSANAISNEEHEKMLKSLGSPIDYTRDAFQDNVKNRHEQTCEWILERRALLDWTSKDFAQGKPKILWLHGGPGFGKTVLCARIIEHLQPIRQPLAYFFCMSEIEVRRDPITILRSWIAQAIDGNDRIFKLLRSSQKIDHKQPATTEDLWEIFTFVASNMEGTFVVDGFDECSSASRARRYSNVDARSEFLKALVKAIAGSTSNVLIVSRDMVEIRAGFKHLSVETNPAFLEYNITAKDTSEDITSFSKNMVDRRLENKPQHLREDIAKQAAEKSGGMFLWVTLLESELDPGENSKTLLQTVAEMPEGVDTAYERDLQRILQLKQGQRNRALILLRWVLFALRPLTVRELAEAIAVAANETATTYPLADLPDKWQDGFVDEEYVNSVIRRPCGSLIDVRCNKDGDPLSLHSVHLVHYSVKEYLLKSGQEKASTIGFPDSIKEHDLLAKFCLQYLCYDVFGKTASMQYKIGTFPFYKYAARFWRDHATHREPLNSKVEELVLKLLDPEMSNWRLWANWFEHHMIADAYSAQRFRYWSGSSDDEEDSQERDDDEDSKNSDDEEDSKNGDDDQSIANKVGSKKIGNSNSDDDCNEPCSIKSENEDVGKSSTDATLNANEQKANRMIGGNPLYYAAMLNLPNIIKALKQRGVDCNAAGGRLGFPLYAAVACGSRNAVETLVELGADVQKWDCGGLTSLDAALASRNVELVQILLAAGANPNVQCNGFVQSTPLHAAIKFNNKELIQILLAAGADPNAQSSEHTPLWEAIMSTFSGNMELIQLLLDADADPNFQNSEGMSILQFAIRSKRKKIARELIRQNADCMAATSQGHTCLHEAASIGDVESIRLLLDQKVPVDIDARDHMGNSSLQVAIFRKNYKAVKLLLEEGVDVNAKDLSGSTALHSAARCRDPIALKLLIEAGADVNVLGYASETRLLDAIKKGSFIPMDLSIWRESKFTNPEEVRNLVTQGGLMGECDQKANLMEKERQNLEGKWAGFYQHTGTTWYNGHKQKTQIDVIFDEQGPDTLPFTFRCCGQDEAGHFFIEGQVLNGSRLRWVKMYQFNSSIYTIYDGACVEEEMLDGRKQLKLQGTWGREQIDGQFAFTKCEKYNRKRKCAE